MGLGSRLPESTFQARAWRLSFWPRSLFGQLFVAVFIGVVAATLISLFLVIRERDRTLVQASVREWSRRVVDMTASMQLLEPAERTEASSLLQNWPRPQYRRPRPPPGPVLEPLFEPPACPRPFRISNSRWRSSCASSSDPDTRSPSRPPPTLRRAALTLSRPRCRSIRARRSTV